MQNNFQWKNNIGKYFIENITYDEHNNTNLHLACMEQSQYKVEQILQNDTIVNIESKNNHGQSALHIACAKNNEHIVDILIKANANTNTIDNYGRSPLHIICDKNTNINYNIFKLLVDANADINLKNNLGWTVLHVAAHDSKKYNNVDMIKLLLEKSADVNLLTKSKFTPLYLACTGPNINLPVVNLLMEYGADIMISMSNDLARLEYLDLIIKNRQSMIKRAVQT